MERINFWHSLPRRISATVLLAAGAAFLTGCAQTESVPVKFEPAIESLKAYECPEWFRDAKFGIYLHWGVYSVAERGEWSARNMYDENRPEYAYHVKTYGHPSKFGYKDFIPMWKAENFDPDRLVKLFQDAGARYFTPCAVHHDNFDLWNSKYHRYNSVNMGPKKDIMRMWHDAVLKHGLRFGATTHLSRSYSWFQLNKGADTKGPFQGVPYDGNDPEWVDFYHPKSDDTDRRQPRNPPESWRNLWASRIIDLIDNYDLDLLYFDGAIPFEGDDRGRTGMRVIADFYNKGLERHHGKQDVVMFIKGVKDHGLYVDGVATLDIERKRAGELLSQPWQTDTSIGPWGYNATRKYRPVNEIIDELVDIVSKNGNMLLNVPPKADGTLDNETVRILGEIGAWMKVNGEAIYETRPWSVYGDGDLRFTKKGEVLYAIALDWPEGQLTIPASAVAGKVSPVSAVSLLGYSGKLSWENSDEDLTIKMPANPPCQYAFAFKLAF